MAQETLYDLFVKALQQIAAEIVAILPKILLTVVVFAIAVLVIKFLNVGLRKLLSLVKLDQMFERVIKTELPFSLSGLIIALVDLGIILIALFGTANLFLAPEHIELMRGILGYAARIVSVIAITVLTFVLFNALIDRMAFEAPMRGYVVFIVLIIATMMIIDLTNLSDSTKRALVDGLSTGLAISIGVFAIWFFFHEHLDRLLDAKTSPRKNLHNE
jgi:hypothetical protein